MRLRPAPGLLLAILPALGACAVVPSAPGGPLQSAGTVQVSQAEIIDVSRAETTTPSRSEKGVYLDAGTMLLARVGGRVSLADWIDAAADLGWSGVGAELRAGAPEGTRLPFAVSIGARSALLAPLVPDDLVRRQYDLRVRLEAYPLLPALGTATMTRLHGVVALGGSRGRHYHELTLRTEEKDQVNVMRNEDRLEGALGVALRGRRAAISLIAMPYHVTHASAPTVVSCGIAHCNQVDANSLRSFQQDFGVSLMLTVGLVLNGH